MDGLEKEYGDRITFVHVNILDSNNTPIMKQYGFSATPEVYLVDQRGKVIGFWDEIDSAEDLKPALEKALKQAGG